MALPQQGGLLHLPTDGEDGLHHLHGGLFGHLHGAERGRAVLPHRQGTPEVHGPVEQEETPLRGERVEGQQEEREAVVVLHGFVQQQDRVLKSGERDGL